MPCGVMFVMLLISSGLINVWFPGRKVSIVLDLIYFEEGSEISLIIVGQYWTGQEMWSASVGLT